MPLGLTGGFWATNSWPGVSRVGRAQPGRLASAASAMLRTAVGSLRLVHPCDLVADAEDLVRPSAVIRERPLSGQLTATSQIIVVHGFRSRD